MLAAVDSGELVAEPQATVLSAGHYVRVDLARLDELMRMIGDLVIRRARLVDGLGADRSTRAGRRLARASRRTRWRSSGSCASCAKA